MFVFRGIPGHIGSDNGPEFTTKMLLIKMGSLWDNGYIESFIGKMRDEMFSLEPFTLVKVKILIKEWSREYNKIRPNGALDYKPSVPETILLLSLK